MFIVYSFQSLCLLRDDKQTWVVELLSSSALIDTQTNWTISLVKRRKIRFDRKIKAVLVQREQFLFSFNFFSFSKQNSARHNVYLVHEKACNASETFSLKIDIWVRCRAMNEFLISAIFRERKTI